MVEGKRIIPLQLWPATPMAVRKWVIPVALIGSALWIEAMGQQLPARDPVARLSEQLEQHHTSLDYEPRFGYLRALLDRLGLRVDSQVLVFSKTSLQDALISPRTPRAIYFGDDVAVAFTRGGTLELAALDPGRGIAFYTLVNQPADVPRFERHGTECARCHGAVNRFALGLMVTNSPTSEDGTPVSAGGTRLFDTTDHRTPFTNRWGGWYVTGTHGSQKHLGNVAGFDPVSARDAFTQNVTNLADRLETADYLAPTSDLVALMTLEHQTMMVNLIASVDAQFRGVGATTADAATRSARLDEAIDELVAYMLFVDEAPLEQPVAGVSTFAKTFASQGPRDSRGRSLRDFDLQRRLFTHRLTYMIYSDFFLGMNTIALERTYRRLYDVLAGRDAGQRFSKLSAIDRRAILEILRETQPRLPAYWY